MQNINLLNYFVEKEQFINSDKLLDYVRKLNNKKIRYIKTDFIKTRNNNLVTMKDWRNYNETIDLNEIEVLITGHSDHSIDNSELNILNNPNLKCWICQNKNIEHPKLHSVPIGITNPNEPRSSIHRIIGNTDKILEISKTEKKIKKLVYLNINPGTCRSERSGVINKFKEKEWVTYAPHIISYQGHESFLKSIYEHKFVFAPRGRGIDTHRMWESLYLRTIPIVRKTTAMKDFYDLPILFIDNWDDITEEYLEIKYQEIINKKYNIEKINVNYWINRIKEYSHI